MKKKVISVFEDGYEYIHGVYTAEGMFDLVTQAKEQMVYLSKEAGRAWLEMANAQAEWIKRRGGVKYTAKNIPKYEIKFGDVQ